MIEVADCSAPFPLSERTNAPSRIIVHCMAEFLDLDPKDMSAYDFLISQGLSAHILVTPGGTCIRMLNDGAVGAHAKGHNQNTLGIEFLVPGVHTYGSFLERIKKPYVTEAQYTTGVLQVCEWMDTYGIDSAERHSDISPGRKFDPGDGFPWNDFLEDISSLSSTPGE